MTLPLDRLLPLRAVEVCLRFLAPAHPQAFHQPAMTAYVRSLIGGTEDHYSLLYVDTPENGRCSYEPRDRYRFTIYTLAGGEALLERLLTALQNLPRSASRSDVTLPFRDNLAWVEARGLFSGEPVRTVAELTPYGPEDLKRETALWASQKQLHLRWLSPVRLLLPKQQRERGLGRDRGEARYCRGKTDVTASLLVERLHDAIAALLRERHILTSPRNDPPAPQLDDADLFWVDAGYKDSEGAYKTMGGMLGEIAISSFDTLPDELHDLWVLGQYLGIGQRRAFGWGRYRLETVDGQLSCPRAEPASSMLERAAGLDNLRDAWHAINANRSRRQTDRNRDEAADLEWHQYLELDAEQTAVDEDEDDVPGDRLERMAERLSAGTYERSVLRGSLHRNPDGSVRPLAIPPFFDRVAQRAVAQTIGAGLDAIMSAASFGYRRGRSRHDASRLIQRAYKEGYRWVYESDIDDFFDTVNWRHLSTRLSALFGDDPVVALILSWMGAPVEYKGQTIKREAGLPQGAPLSPVLANLVLDDFDSDLETAGFKLARFADDFVILCKDREQAEAAAKAAEASLAEFGLALNAEKTRITTFASGFRYLGYLFAGSLALDVSGESRQHAPSPSDTEPPANSWLARLNRKTPRELKPDATLAGDPGSIHKSKPEQAISAPGEPLRIGNAPADSSGADDGTMVFVTGAPALLSTRRGRLRVVREDRQLIELPWNGIRAVLLFGPHSPTAPALRTALQKLVPIHFASSGGRYQGVLWNGSPSSEGIDLWLQQSACFQHTETALLAARAMVDARLRHLREMLRQRATDSALDDAIDSIDQALRSVSGATDLQKLNGIEGNGTRAAFRAMSHLIPPSFGFEGRNRRPPRDPFNSLLSLGYSVLYCHVETILQADGLLPWRGFYHQPHGRHATLASDLMEPFRHLIERSALTAVTRGTLGIADFVEDNRGGCRMTDEARRKWLSLLTRRFDTPIKALDDAEPRPIYQHLHRQNRRLIAWIRDPEATFTAWRTR